MSFLAPHKMGERVHALRGERGLGVADLASSARLEAGELAAIEAGARGLAVAEVDALAAALGVPAEGLLMEDALVAPLYRNEGGDEAAARAESEFAAVMDDFFTFQAAVRR